MKDLLNMIGDGVFSRFESSLKKKNSTSKIKSSFADSSNLKTQSNLTLKTQSASASEKKISVNTEVVGSVYSVTTGSHSILASSLFQKLNQTILVVSENNTSAEFLFREALSFLPSNDLIYLPGQEVLPYEYMRYPSEMKRERIKAIAKILSGEPVLIFTSVSGFLKTLPPIQTMQGRAIVLKKGKEIDLESLLIQLIDLGYKRVQVCETFGEFSLKGGILDIFSSYSTEPVRIDLFGEEIESIRTFDPDSQRSMTDLDQAVLLPADEYILSEEQKKEYQNFLKSSDSSLHLPEIPEGNYGIYYEELIPLVRENHGILSYFSEPPILIFPSTNSVKERLFHLEKEYLSLFEKRSREVLCAPPEKLLSFGEEFKVLSESIGLSFVGLPPRNENDLVSLLKEAPSFKGKIREVREKISELRAKGGWKIVLTSSFEAQTKRLQGLFEKEGVILLNEDSTEPLPFHLGNHKSDTFLVLSELRNGFILENQKILILSENDIFGREYKRKTRFKKQNSKALQSFIDLKEGDYVVHIHHGVGKFLKIERTSAGGKERDFLKLEYSGGDSLFVPLDQISLVQRYIGGTESPRLDSLGKSTWKKTKDRVQKAVEALAEDLVQMYSNRLKLQGYAFPPDTIYQEEFEAEFEYEETPDQIEAIEAVKKDLESSRPMDRLVCGDVGYGKTEVAIRAAFKVAMAGRQIMMLAPTTILALQHYNTFKNRFENYPVRVELVSRFKTPAEIRDILADFSAGKVDMVVGTHAILSSKLKPKNLGLLIIDEEQRFGVNHKETIKKFKNLMDVLTLTATPIPRTLHMALTGIRELSIIATPPKNRQSVETYVLEEDDDLISDAIRNEIQRGGQVFYLYNRVETIEEETNYLSKLVPEVSIGILHGQMTEDEIEETLLDFYNRKYDILVTTTIIESGIDMPNVNTLFVKRADLFGLSQLYQIRGRVGRSDRKAFAYMLLPKDRVVTEQAEKRLNTIFEYQELGSGFKVAMRDLEIRGAGNLLGKEQSGDIMEVGFDLYVRMLEDAIARIKGEEIVVEVRTSVTLNTNFFIPETYISDTRQKIEFYKKLEGARDLDEIEEIYSEMLDRFGEPPEDAKTFILLEKIRTLASNLGFEFVTEMKDEIKMKSGSYFRGDHTKIIQLISARTGLTLNPKEPNVLIFQTEKKLEKEKLDTLIFLLSEMLPSKKV
ncbi:transcription-repair coupling factor [Leptospira interrogans]|uniref:Transcription-repair-coupling factor n=1 Tax=Leptospira interrogans serovar Hardjo str. Norma TaxID=1279460 RepID=A0A0M4N9L8_LEPIR|nr:transcription-repair coupling factor [Leptospira interrogans]ALE39814.1 transcription-repair coupling factor [Leptospira interrogans serovar Hardjo str. Norma]ALO00886.1 transcription-repair coupling factor [Leptospira interrogans serovar Hardjo-prajitno]EKO98737.1 transcription-repair coupling factor [Leptospira interrogans str. Brem 329]MCD1165739.1 transcription-repair coupling factor [Leptospira interrogans]MCH1886719.1 transcription-repair coupling factor [Leptospira interrogans]